jgi:hypothetical protein
MMRQKWLVPVALIALAGCTGKSHSTIDTTGVSDGRRSDWLSDFQIAGRTLAATGKNPYFILEPGFQLVLEGRGQRLTITVLNETKEVDGTLTRVVEEREEKSGQLVEVSRNYFAISPDTGDVFYFGEDVDMYEDGKITGHSGAWQAGQSNAKPGLITPGRLTVGMKYYQEQAPGKAMDRARVVSLTETRKTPAGTFTGCLKTEESSALSPREKEFKIYAPGIGLIQEEDLLLTRYGPAASPR